MSRTEKRQLAPRLLCLCVGFPSDGVSGTAFGCHQVPETICVSLKFGHVRILGWCCVAHHRLTMVTLTGPSGREMSSDITENGKRNTELEFDRL